MNNICIAKIKEIIKSKIFWIVSIITIFAIILRSIPSWLNAAWGCDFGIYLGITKSMALTKELFPAYTGWGSSYNEFPILYLINVAAHMITGIEIIELMPKLTPIFGGLSVLIFYFVAKELTKNKKISVLASLFFAVMPFHVYQTSHAAPLTIGHFFLMLSLYLFLRYRRDKRFIIPLLISTLLLIMSHHLTTYFYLIIIIFIVFLENITQDSWTKTVKRDSFYVVFASAIMFFYWSNVAKTVYDSFMSSGLRIAGIRLQPFMIIGLFYLVFALMFLFIKFFKKYRKNLLKYYKRLRKIIKTKKDYDKARSKYRYLYKFSILLLISLILLTLFSFIKIPWVNFKLNAQAIFYSLPFIIAISIGATSFRYIYRQKFGKFIIGWLFAVIISFLYALITDNRIILPHRHIEYMMAPFSFFVLYGLGGIFSDPDHKALLTKLKSNKTIIIKSLKTKFKITQKKRLAHLIAVLVLVISLASTTYASYQSLNVAVERIHSQDIAAINWISENLDRNTTIIASDHRLEVLAESEGFNTTSSETLVIWTAENLSNYIAELAGIGKNYSRITHIIIDDIMKNDVVHIHEKIFFTMTNETWTKAYDKFHKLPFNRVYPNETINIDQLKKNKQHWTEVFEVDWNYLEENHFIID